MGYIILAILLLVLWIGLLAVSFNCKRKANKIDTTAGGMAIREKRDLQTWSAGLKVGGWIAFGLLVLFTLVKSVVIVDVGHSAVSTFAGDTQGDMGNGVHFVAPWYNIIDYETRTQEYTMAGDGEGEGIESAAITAPTADGSNVRLDLTVRYQLNSAAVGEMYEQYGSDDDFEQKVIFNDLRAVARDVVVRYDALEARAQRETIGPEMAAELQERWGDLARVELVNIRDLKLDDTVQEAANNVLRAQEEARAREFVLDQEETNADIERVRAQGIADSQQIIVCGGTVTTDDEGNDTVIPNSKDDCDDQLSPELLTWKYLETLAQVGEHGNLIIVPGGENGEGMEIIVDTPEPVPAE